MKKSYYFHYWIQNKHTLEEDEFDDTIDYPIGTQLDINGKTFIVMDKIKLEA